MPKIYYVYCPEERKGNHEPWLQIYEDVCKKCGAKLKKEFLHEYELEPLYGGK